MKSLCEELAAHLGTRLEHGDESHPDVQLFVSHPHRRVMLREAMRAEKKHGAKYVAVMNVGGELFVRLYIEYVKDVSMERALKSEQYVVDLSREEIRLGTAARRVH